MGALQCLELGRLVTRFFASGACARRERDGDRTPRRSGHPESKPERDQLAAPVPARRTTGTLRGALLGCGCLFCQAAKNAAVTPSPVPEGKATR
jgi:hypothetical protein